MDCLGSFAAARRDRSDMFEAMRGGSLPSAGIPCAFRDSTARGCVITLDSLSGEPGAHRLRMAGAIHQGSAVLEDEEVATSGNGFVAVCIAVRKPERAAACGEP